MKYAFGIILTFAFVFLSGCNVGPDYVRPDLPISAGDGFARGGGYDVNSLDIDFRWWQNFGDVVTSQLVEKSLASNYKLKAAAASVLQAQASYEEAIGKQLPSVSYGLGYNRAKTVITVDDRAVSSLSTNYSQSLSVSYNLDLFGKLRHAKQSRWDEYLASQANRSAVINSLIASVVNSRIDIATSQRQLNIARRVIASRQRSLEIVERRYSNGRVSSVDVRLARENLAAAKAVEPDIELAIALRSHILDILLGDTPGTIGSLPETLADLPNLEPIAIGIPAGLLDRRPDVQAAELRLKAINENVSVSIAQLYPDFTLTGSYGFRSQNFDDIFNDDFNIYSLVANATQSIWKGGQLRANVRGAKAKYQEAVYNYCDTVLNALKEVEDALVTEDKLQKKYEYLQVQFAQAKKAEELSLNRYSLGLEKLLTYLESERRRINAENNLVHVKGNLWTNRVNLFLALGGNWTDNKNIEVENNGN